jgi:RimJ/RimL family protein N-acetyltransferase
VLRPAYPIETERLLLRPFASGDLDALARINGDPEVVRYLYYGVRGPDELREALAEKMQLTELAQAGDRLNLAAVLAASGELVGDVSLAWRSAEHRQGEIGYLLDPAHAGNGYATEAAREMLRLGFEELGLHRIIGKLDARNEPSARVLERLGMRLESRMLQNEFVKGEWTDEVTYALLEHEWRA